MARTSPTEDHEAESRHGRSAQPELEGSDRPVRLARSRVPEAVQAPSRKRAPHRTLGVGRRTGDH